MRAMLESQLELVNRMEHLTEETKKNVARTERSEKIVFKVANLVIDKYDSIVMKENLEDWESDEISRLIGEKTTEITRLLNPSMSPNKKKGEEYYKRWTKVNRGLYTIYKRNVNGHKGPYSHTQRVKFESAKEYIKSLSSIDYNYLRSGKLQYIKKFNFKEPVLQEKLDIEKLINEQLDMEENVNRRIQ